MIEIEFEPRYSDFKSSILSIAVGTAWLLSKACKVRYNELKFSFYIMGRTGYRIQDFWPFEYT